MSIHMTNDEWEKVIDIVTADPSFESTVRTVGSDVHMTDLQLASAMRGAIKRAVNEVYVTPEDYTGVASG